jgi:type I restriction enzyme, S subunit
MPRMETRTGGRAATDAIVPGRFVLSIGKSAMDAQPGFRWRLLGELARLESGHTPSRSHPEYWDGGVPWIGIRDATAHHGETIFDTNQHVSKLGLANSSARLLPAGTVCLSRTASVGFVVRMGIPMATSQDFVNWVCGPQMSSRYLAYILMLEQDSIRRFAYGTTHQTLYYPDAKALWVCVPPPPDQDRIADVLGALDNKITANTRICSLVDELLAARLTDHLAFSDTSTVALRSIARVNASAANPNTGHLRYIDIAAVGVGSFEYPDLSDWSEAPSRARRRVAEGDTLWSSVRPNRRSHALNLSDDPLLVASTGLAVLSPKQVGFAYLYEVAKRPEFSAYLETVAEGSAYPAVKPDRFEAAPVPLLPDDERNRFEQAAAPLRRRAHSAMTENRLLAQLRDTLLPLLMTGKLRVRDAEKRVGAVV